jgi:hypothetical protein
VDQRTGLDELQRRQGRDELRRVDAAGPPVPPVGERRPQPFAAPQDEVFQRLGGGYQRRLDRGQPAPLPGQELGERLVDAGTQVGAIKWRNGHS